MMAFAEHAGRYQGVHWRRVARYLFSVVLLLLFIGPDVVRSESVATRLVAIAATVVAVVLCELWFARRMGITIDHRGLVLHYAFRRMTVAWSDIRSFEWHRWNSPRSEWIWIRATNDRRIRIPTVQRPPHGNPRSFADSFLGSPAVRDSSGHERDTMDLLDGALLAIQSDSALPT